MDKRWLWPAQVATDDAKLLANGSAGIDGWKKVGNTHDESARGV